MEVKGKKRKCYLSFTDEERARMGQYAAENGNNAALKKFRAQFPDLGESTVSKSTNWIKQAYDYMRVSLLMALRNF